MGNKETGSCYHIGWKLPCQPLLKFYSESNLVLNIAEAHKRLMVNSKIAYGIPGMAL